MLRTVILGLALLASLLSAAEWPQFRGPGGTGIAEGRQLPSEFGEDTNLLWKSVLPPGHSSPVVAGDRIYLTAFEGKTLQVIAVDRSNGEVEWIRTVPRPREENFQRTHGPASPSPVTDGENIYAFFGDFGLISFDADGNERWQRPLGPFINQNGHGSSPILVEGMVILVCDQQVGSYLLAVSAETGETLWKTDRPETTRGYGTAGVFRPDGAAAQVIVPGAYRVAGYDLKSGEELWWVTGFAWQLKCLPLFRGDTIYINGWEIGGDPGQQQETASFADVIAKHDANGDGKISQDESPDKRLTRDHPWREADLDGDGALGERDWRFYAAKRAPINNLVAIRPGDLRGDITESGVAWRYTKSLPNTPSPLLYKDVIYMVKDGGIFSSVDPDKGEAHRVGRLSDAIGKYWSSPVAGDGKIYTISEGCLISTIEPGPNWRVKNVSELDGTCFATPAIVDGQIYVRSLSALYAFGVQ